MHEAGGGLGKPAVISHNQPAIIKQARQKDSSSDQACLITVSSFVMPAVLTGRHACIFFEYAIEGSDCEIADERGNLLNEHIGFQQHFLRLAHAHFIDVVAEIRPAFFFEITR